MPPVANMDLNNYKVGLRLIDKESLDKSKIDLGYYVEVNETLINNLIHETSNVGYGKEVMEILLLLDVLRDVKFDTNKDDIQYNNDIDRIKEIFNDYSVNFNFDTLDDFNKKFINGYNNLIVNFQLKVIKYILNLSNDSNFTCYAKNNYREILIVDKNSDNIDESFILPFNNYIESVSDMLGIDDVNQFYPLNKYIKVIFEGNNNYTLNNMSTVLWNYALCDINKSYLKYKVASEGASKDLMRLVCGTLESLFSPFKVTNILSLTDKELSEKSKTYKKLIKLNKLIGYNDFKLMIYLKIYYNQLSSPQYSMIAGFLKANSEYNDRLYDRVDKFYKKLNKINENNKTTHLTNRYELTNHDIDIVDISNLEKEDDNTNKNKLKLLEISLTQNSNNSINHNKDVISQLEGIKNNQVKEDNNSIENKDDDSLLEKYKNSVVKDESKFDFDFEEEFKESYGNSNNLKVLDAKVMIEKEVVKNDLILELLDLYSVKTNDTNYEKFDEYMNNLGVDKKYMDAFLNGEDVGYINLMYIFKKLK